MDHLDGVLVVRDWMVQYDVETAAPTCVVAIDRCMDPVDVRGRMEALVDCV